MRELLRAVSLVYGQPRHEEGAHFLGGGQAEEAAPEDIRVFADCGEFERRRAK